MWYGAQCYAAAYAEQVQRVLAAWAYNMCAASKAAQLSPATVTWGLVTDVLSSRTPGMAAMVHLLQTTCSRRQAGEDERGSFRVIRCLTLNMYAGRHTSREALTKMAALYNQWRLVLAYITQQRLLTWRANAHSSICSPVVGYRCNMLSMAVCDILHTAVWRSLHLWRAAAMTAGNLQQPRLWASKAVQPHIAIMARRSQRMQRAVTAMAGTTPHKDAMRHAEEAYRLRVAATKQFTNRAGAVATIRARFMANVVRRDTPQRLRHEAAREVRSENNHADKRAQEYLEHLQRQYINEYCEQQWEAAHAEHCQQEGTAADPITLSDSGEPTLVSDTDTDGGDSEHSTQSGGSGGP